MLNQLNNIFHRQSRPADRSDRLWEVDDHPDRRLIWLMLLFGVLFAFVLTRVGWIQVVKTDRFLEALSRPMTRESFEPIPSQDGRILGADGEVLAYDEELFVVKMHYRWLEEPANPRWLRERAIERLSRADRGNKDKVRAQQDQILLEREQMWQSLAKATGFSADELTKERKTIQQRVARIRKNVEERRAERQLERVRQHVSKHAVPRPDDRDASALSPAVAEVGPYWEALVHELTTLSWEHEYEPLVLEEELAYHSLLSDIKLPVAARIESHPEVYPGVIIESTSRRIYPDGQFAEHIVGFRATISDDELASRRAEFPKGDPLDYQAGDRIGKNGVEKSYDRQLRGLRGLKRIVKNRQGEVLLTEVVREPRMGQDVILTLHPELQRKAEKLLSRVLDPVSSESKPSDIELASATDDTLGSPAENALAENDEVDEQTATMSENTPRGASLVVLDIHSGAVLAGVSAPGFDLNVLLGDRSPAWNQLMQDERRPLFPRMTHMAIPPGSVFKTVSSVAILESGMIDPDDTRHCQGFLVEPNRYRCYIYRHFGVGHGDLNFQDAFAQSCNVYFFDTAREIGFQQISGWADRLGYGRPTGIDLPGEKSGNLPRPAKVPTINTAADEKKPKHQGDRRALAETLGLAIGQSRLTATPIQVARMMAAVANGGDLVTPHVVGSYGPMGAEFSQRKYTDSDNSRIAVSSPSTWERLREALDRVVSHPRGTGYKTVRIEGVSIAGKTGTAEVGGGKPDHAWFAGFVPADRPRYAFVVVLENGGSGGRDAGPVARQLVEAMVQLELLSAKDVAQQE
ncbi:MAG: peptidoglycan D,D-transpeptidase FtsI family protein [Planctomycetaceae bacterium]